PRVLHLYEALAWLASNTLCGRIRRNQFRVRSLKLFEFLHQAVKVGVRNLRSIQDVIEVFVAANVVAQLLNLVFDGLVFSSRGHVENYMSLQVRRSQDRKDEVPLLNSVAHS